MNRLAVIAALGLLFFGALNTLATKMTFQMTALDLSGHITTFQKPWFGVYRMFQGMCFVMPLHFIKELLNWQARKRAAAGNYVASDAGVTPATPLKSYFVVIIPATLDLLGTTCTYVGLFYNTPSVWQMFRGAMVVFATFFSITILKRRLNTIRWIGVGIVVIAITIVGISNMMNSQSAETHVDPNLKLFGMGMILLGMLLQGGQIVVEEFLMKDLDAPPLLVVGMEGVWGCVIMMAVIFPIVEHLPGDDYGGVQESLKNDIAMVHNNVELQHVILVYLVSVFTFNIAGMMVTYALSAVHRTMLEASRTAVIWVIDITIHANFPNSSFGEVWTSYSILQLVGFVLLVLGQATYAELITWGRAVPAKPAEAILSPACMDPGMFSSPKSPSWMPPMSPGRSMMYSPKGQLDMGADLADDFSLNVQPQ